MKKQTATYFELWVSVALFLFSVAYGVGALRLPLPQGSDQIPLTPRSIPSILAMLGALLSGIIIIQTIFKKEKRTAKTARRTEGFTIAQWMQEHRGIVKVVLLLLAMLLYGIILPWCGFLVSSFVFIAVGVFVLDQRKWYIFLGVPLATVIIFWILLEVLLGVYLGEGELYFMILDAVQGGVYE